MLTESRVFNSVAAFLFLAAGTYAWWTDKEGAAPEWIGTVALVLSGLLCAMCGFYFGFVARRIDLRPEDREDAEITEGAGVVGFFSPGSYWPFGLAVGVAIAGTALAYGYNWLLAVGMAGVILATGGLVFEYYTGARRDNHP